MSRKLLLALLGLSIGVVLIGGSSLRDSFVGSARAQTTKQECLGRGYGWAFLDGRCSYEEKCFFQGRYPLGSGRCGCRFGEDQDSQGRCRNKYLLSECTQRGLQTLADGRCGCQLGQPSDSRGRCISPEQLAKSRLQELQAKARADECMRRGLVRIGERCGCPSGLLQDQQSGKCVCPSSLILDKNGKCVSPPASLDTCARQGLVRIGDRCGCPYGQVQDKAGRCVATKSK